MDIHSTKLELLKVILENENAEFIQRLLNFVKSENPDLWSELSSEEQREIKKGIRDLDEGRRTSYESFLKKIS